MINRETPLAKIAGQMSLSMKLQTFQPNPGSSSVYSGDAPMSYPEHRLKEHRRTQEGTEGHREAQASGNTAQPVVAEHAVDQMHAINWSEAQVVACHPYYHQRCTLEARHIHKECQTTNRDAGPLPSVYDPQIHQSCL